MGKPTGWDILSVYVQSIYENSSLPPLVKAKVALEEALWGVANAAFSGARAVEMKDKLKTNASTIIL